MENFYQVNGKKEGMLRVERAYIEGHKKPRSGRHPGRREAKAG